MLFYLISILYGSNALPVDSLNKIHDVNVMLNTTNLDINGQTNPLIAPCYLTGNKYVTGRNSDDMAGQGRTSEESPEACQARCNGVAGCEFFTFWVDGGCHLQSSAAREKEAAASVISGPKECPPASTCWIHGRKYVTGRNDVDGVANEGRTVEESALACQERCSTVADCAFFSYWVDGGCHLQNAGAREKGADSSVLAGPKSCS